MKELNASPSAPLRSRWQESWLQRNDKHFDRLNAAIAKQVYEEVCLNDTVFMQLERSILFE